MQVRFLMHSFGEEGGGVRTVLYAVAAELVKHHDVEIIALYGHPPVHPGPPDGVTTRVLVPHAGLEGGPVSRALARIPSRATPRQVNRSGVYNLYSDLVLRRYLRSVRGGAVITMQPALSIALGRFGTDHYLRIAQEHLPALGRSEDVQERYDRYAHRFDAFLTLTATDARHYHRRLGDRTIVRAMRNPTPVWDGPLSTLDATVAVAAGRLEPIKGFHLVIRAWRLVHAAHPAWRLRIYGEGSRRAQLQRTIDECGLSGIVTLEGHTDRLRDRMAEASFLVVGSQIEGYPMVVVEAMSCGLPVVSVDCPSGPRDIITPGEDGYLVRRRKARPLARAINRMIEVDDGQRRAMGRAARAKAASRGPEEIGRRWEDLLRELSEEAISP